MNSRLQGISAKVQRAEENIRKLNDEITAFLSRNPNPYNVTGEFENNGLEYVVKAYGKLDIPLRFSVIFGEIIHHLRSVFDYLICALVEEQSGTPTRAHKFPVCFSASEFAETSMNGCIDGISASAVTLIESVQPYNTEIPTTCILGVLTELDNTDKHQLLILFNTVVGVQPIIPVGQANDSPDTTNPAIKLISPPDTHSRVASNEGVEVFRVGLTAPDPSFYVDAKVSTKITFQIGGLPDYLDIVPTLTTMLQYTARTIKKFSTEFRTIPW